MYTLTTEQRVANYRELIDNNEKKIKNLQDNNKALEAKIQKLLTSSTTETKKKSQTTDPLLAAANAAYGQ